MATRTGGVGGRGVIQIAGSKHGGLRPKSSFLWHSKMWPTAKLHHLRHLPTPYERAATSNSTSASLITLARCAEKYCSTDFDESSACSSLASCTRRASPSDAISSASSSHVVFSATPSPALSCSTRRWRLVTLAVSAGGAIPARHTAVSLAVLPAPCPPDADKQ